MSDAALLALAPLLPAALCALLGTAWLLGFSLRERPVARMSAACYATVLLALAELWRRRAAGGMNAFAAEYGSWFHEAGHSYPVTLWADGVSLPLLCLAAALLGLVAVFSRRYLHREAGFHRFFFLLNLFGAGILTVFSAGTFDLIIAGWELVCVTSALLIAFFQHRDEPPRGALRAFIVFRACDVGLLGAAGLMHMALGTSEFSQVLASPSGAWATAAAFLLILAAMGKGAQVPFSGWLPRAMEGPTPSSAIFYGALSVHAGAYLLLRSRPLLAAAPWAGETLVVVGLLTALHATLAGRACSDVKSALAYAAMTQMGLIFAEIGLGWERLALWHIIGHAVLRTGQLLQAPSALHAYHKIQAAYGGHLPETGAMWKSLIGEGLRGWLYRLALDRGHHDIALEHYVAEPALALARGLRRLERGGKADD